MISIIARNIPFVSYEMAREFVKFITVGVINTGCNYAVFLFFLLVIDLHYLVAGAFGFLVGAVVGFSLNRKWTFASGICFKRGLAKYMAVQIFCLLIHSLTQFSVIYFFNIAESLSQFAGIVVTTFLNFFLVRVLVFRG